MVSDGWHRHAACTAGAVSRGRRASSARSLVEAVGDVASSTSPQGSRYAQAREGDVVARGSAIVLGALGGVLCAAALIALTKT